MQKNGIFIVCGSFVSRRGKTVSFSETFSITELGVYYREHTWACGLNDNAELHITHLLSFSFVPRHPNCSSPHLQKQRECLDIFLIITYHCWNQNKDKDLHPKASFHSKRNRLLYKILGTPVNVIKCSQTNLPGEQSPRVCLCALCPGRQWGFSPLWVDTRLNS